MNTLESSLLQMMIQLTRIKNSSRVKKIFLESLSELFPGVQFKYLISPEETELELYEIKSGELNFGWIAVDYGATMMPVSNKTYLQKAVEILAEVLENRCQFEKLIAEKEHLKKDIIKQAEILQAREEQYRALAENSEDLILRFDKDRHISYVNSSAERILNLNRAFVHGKSIYELNLTSEQASFWEKNLERVFSTAISINESYTFPTEKGKLIYDIKFVPEFTEDNEVLNVMATARDITELKGKERELFDNQWHLMQAQRIGKIGSWEFIPKYNKLICSEELHRIFGLDYQTALFPVEKLKQFLTPGIQQKLDNFISNFPGIVDPFEFEIAIMVNNEMRYCQIKGESIYGRSGHIKKIHGTLQDFTERKQMEQELEDAKKKAEESDKLKSAFLANMSHEIRTPLNGILGFSEILRRRNLQAEKRQFYTEIINSNGKQLLKIISDIIDISKIESGQIKLEETHCYVKDMLVELFTIFENDLNVKGKNNISLKLELPENASDVRILCDELRVRQVLSNLLANAIKFTYQGSIVFGYCIRGNNIEFFVRDTGIGIKFEYQKMVFERFRQANEGVSREFGGTGLGLAISKSFVELMGGKIWVDSKEGEGSEFRFSFATEIQDEPIPTSSEKYLNGHYNWSGKRILIVEDDLPSVHFFQETLEETHAVLFHADDGVKAIELTQEHKPDIILMDIRLPKVNGLDAIKTIRQKNTQVRIIAITANAFAEDRIKCLKAGSNDYLAKPVERMQLLTTIDKFMQL